MAIAGPDQPPTQPFEEAPICKKCNSEETSWEYQGQQGILTDGEGVKGFMGEDVILVSCLKCSYFWRMEPADKSAD